MLLKTKYLLNVILIALVLFSVLIIEIIFLYFYPSNLVLFYIFILTLGVSIIIFLRYVWGVPFPHEHAKLQNPDPHGYLKLLDKIEPGDRLKIVMGEANPIVLTSGVRNEFSKKIKEIKNVDVKIIIGPKVHTKSKEFFETILKSSPRKARIWKKEERPTRHFRLLENKYLSVEPPHKEFKKSRYWEFVNSYYLNRKYRDLFNEYLEESTPCKKIEDITFVTPKIETCVITE